MKPPYPTRAPESFYRRHVIFWFTLLTALAGVAAYLRMMTGFNLYDDEGTLMITVKQYLAGMRIYDQVFSAYGPVYYFYQWALRTVTATPVTHDVVRIGSLLPWLGVALICGWITLRLTRSLILAAVAHLGTSLVLVFFGNEPGHPQELTLLLLVALAAFPLIAGIENRRTVLMLALGALPAALLLVKINAGAFAMAAVAMTLVSCGPRSRAGLLAAGGFAATFAAVMAILQAQGVSMPVVYDSVVVAPARVFLAHRTWFVAHGLSRFTAPWALAGLGAAVFTAWRQPLPGIPAWRALFAGKTVFGSDLDLMSGKNAMLQSSDAAN